jgi:acetyl-CoA acetyltransferase
MPEHAWARSPRLTPGDVDIAEVYDGWSILSLRWLESLGLCGRGEAAKFIEGGSRMARNGELPVNRATGNFPPAGCTATSSCTKPARNCATGPVSTR